MPTSINTTYPRDLRLISGLIRDAFFRPADVRFNEAKGTLEIPFVSAVREQGQPIRQTLLSRRMKVPVVQCLLRISHVASYEVLDPEQYEWYDFNLLRYDENAQSLTVISNFKYRITAKLTGFAVSAEKTDTTVGEQEFQEDRLLKGETYRVPVLTRK